MELTKNVRDWIMILSDDRQLHITYSQKESISEWIRSKEPLIEVYDVDTKQCLFSGKSNLIKEFRQKKIDGAKYNVICPKGGKHPLYDGEYTCNCV